MNSVLGVSVGATAIKLAQPRQAVESVRLDFFELQSVPTTYQRLPELVVESIRSATEKTAAATVVAYRGESEAASLRAVLERNHLTGYTLVPETTAVLEYLAYAEEVDARGTLVVYDLGGSGLTISVVDTAARVVQYAERTDEISGDLFDALIRDHQITSGSIAAPRSPEGFVELDARCREGKEQLSINPAASLPSDSGLVLLSRENFDAMIAPAVAASARMTVEVIRRAAHPIDAVVAIGGGVRIPAIRTQLREAVGLPVVVPDGPESVCARGAALLARKSAPSAEPSSNAAPLRRAVPPPSAPSAPLVARQPSSVSDPEPMPAADIEQAKSASEEVESVSEPPVPGAVDAGILGLEVTGADGDVVSRAEAEPAREPGPDASAASGSPAWLNSSPPDAPVARGRSDSQGLYPDWASASGHTVASSTARSPSPDSFRADWLSQPDPTSLWYSAAPRTAQKRKFGSKGIAAAVVGALVVIGGVGVGLGLSGGQSTPPHDAGTGSTIVPSPEPSTETPSLTPTPTPIPTTIERPSLPAGPPPSVPPPPAGATPPPLPPPPAAAAPPAPAPENPGREVPSAPIRRAPVAPRRPVPPRPPAAAPNTYVLPLPGAPTVVVPPNVVPHR